MSLEKAVKIVTDACSALEYAHKKYKILHRDLKPSNIMLVTVGGDQEYVKIIDWGIAKILQAEGGATTGPHTQTGAPIGSPAYMSPEQIRGEDLGPSSDVYSLGCVFYECITGEKASKGENPFALMQLHLSNERPLLPSWYAATPIERERLQRLLGTASGAIDFSKGHASTERGSFSNSGD